MRRVQLAVVAAAALIGFSAVAEEQQSAAADKLLADWDAYLDSLKAAGRQIVEKSDGSEAELAEGFQYLAMLAGVGIERNQYYQDPQFPIVARTLDGYKKLGLDSADNTYRTVNFERGGRYRIRGWRGNATYLGFQINAGRGSVANINDGEMQFHEDGEFELYLGGEQRGLNWIALPYNADNMYIREIFIDWDNEIPTRLWIERVDGPGAPERVSVEEMSDRLENAGQFVHDNIALWDGYVSRLRDSLKNAFAPPSTPTAEGGSADNVYSGGYFALAPDEALIIELDPVDALFWNIQLGNRWFQSLDYQYRQSSLNNLQTVIDPDGKVRFVVADRDPGYANWLDNGGHTEGVMYFRWNQPSSVPARPTATVVPFADVASHFPDDAVTLSAEDRQKILRKRYEAVARRFAL